MLSIFAIFHQLAFDLNHFKSLSLMFRNPVLLTEIELKKRQANKSLPQHFHTYEIYWNYPTTYNLSIR